MNGKVYQIFLFSSFCMGPIIIFTVQAHPFLLWNMFNEGKRGWTATGPNHCLIGRTTKLVATGFSSKFHNIIELYFILNTIIYITLQEAACSGEEQFREPKRKNRKSKKEKEKKRTNNPRWWRLQGMTAGDDIDKHGNSNNKCRVQKQQMWDHCNHKSSMFIVTPHSFPVFIAIPCEAFTLNFSHSWSQEGRRRQEWVVNLGSTPISEKWAVTRYSAGPTLVMGTGNPRVSSCLPLPLPHANLHPSQG